MEAATKIQSATKQYLLKKRYYCTNDTDPYTLEKISDIEQLYIFKIVEGNSIHCFDIREMYKQYTTRNEKLFNPFTRRELEDHEINRFLVALTTLSNLGLKLDREHETISEQVTDVIDIPSSIIDTNDGDTEESIININEEITYDQVATQPHFIQMDEYEVEAPTPIFIDNNTIAPPPVASSVTQNKPQVLHESTTRRTQSHKIISSILMYIALVMIVLFVITRFSKGNNLNI